MEKRLISIDINGFPRELRKYFEDARVYDSSSSSAMRVYYVDKGHYVKTAEKGALCNEAVAGKRFYDLGVGIEVIDYLSTDKDYLVTREADGTDLTHCLDKPRMICEILASALSSLHKASVADAPVSPAFSEYMQIADRRLVGTGFKSTAFTERFRIFSRTDAWRTVQNNKHLLSADTLIHGDACLPNVIQKNGAFSTFIDFTMSGVGDKHIDLYWAIWSLWYNLKTDEFTDTLLDMYGREKFDFELIRTVAALEVLG